MSKLGEIFTAALTAGMKTHLLTLKTQYGINDTYLDHFIDMAFAAVAGGTKMSHQDKQKALDALKTKLLEVVMSPIWRLCGLNPHSNTPVEVLHVILLGFVKYMWCDALNRQGDVGKNTLILHLASIDVSSLDISHLNSKTLVTYSGLLTGQDF